MKHIPPNDILLIGIEFFKNLFEGFYYESKLLFIFRAFNIIVLSTSLLFISVNFGYTSGEAYIKTGEGVVTTFHALFKYTLFIYSKSDIQSLLESTKGFWNYEEFESNLRKNVRNIYRNMKVILDIYLVLATSGTILFFFRPVFNRDSVYLYDCWTFSYIELDIIVLFCQYYTWVILLNIAYAYDSLYYAFSCHVVIQLRLLNNKLQNLPKETKIEDISCCITHHQLLMSIYGRIDGIYSWMLFFHYFVTLVTGCSELYVILIASTNGADTIAPIFYFLGLIFEFASYSIPVEEITSELKNISDAIYLSKWYEWNDKIKKTLLTVMMKSQRQNCISAAGLIEINADAFASVIKKMFSFYAVVRNLVNK